MNSSPKPPLKRRKLGTSAAATPSTTPAAIGIKVLGPTVNAKKGATPVCISCQRALQSSTAGSVIQCSVCASTTCAVCSRTCTHSAASQPPTPHLTWSPTPSPSPAPSPRRSVLSLNSTNTNFSFLDLPLTPTQSSVTGKRRKIVDPDDDPKDHDLYGPGCGKLVCRNCCYEDTLNNATTCFQCYGSRV